MPKQFPCFAVPLRCVAGRGGASPCLCLSLVSRSPPLLRGAILCRCDAQGIFAVPSRSMLVAAFLCFSFAIAYLRRAQRRPAVPSQSMLEVAEHCFSFAVHCVALPLPFIGRLFLCWAIQSSASADLCLSLTEQRIPCFAKAPQWLAIPSQSPTGPSSSVSLPLSSDIAFLPAECLAIGSLCCSKPLLGTSMLCRRKSAECLSVSKRFRAVLCLCSA